MGYKAQQLLHCLALQSRDASVHSLQRSDDGLNSITLFLTELPLASLNKQHLCFQDPSTTDTASVWWSGCSVHLQPWLFSLWLFVSSSARQSTSPAASPCTPVIHSQPSAFQTHPNTTRAHYIRGLVINQLVSPDAGKKLTSGTWKPWECLFVMEMEHKSHYLLIFSACI